MRQVDSILVVKIVLVLLSFSMHAFAGESAASVVLDGSSAAKVHGEMPECLNMIHGNIVSTGNPLDTAIWGDGYIVLNDGLQYLYSR